ncbi:MULTISPECIES: hypothetical protein [unclassified Carboxylicivirga]|uniref:hypothetical protein n=1 Tax=Carboxylicivirga TaxID=1628153 RepID=UPI003D335CFC
MKCYFNFFANAVLVLFFISCSNHGNIIYVKQDGGGTKDGSSWSNAYDDIQNAINVAQDGDSIFIANGTYSPSSINGYKLTKNIFIIGGFKGFEQSSDEREFYIHESGLKKIKNVTIISGDINQDDDFSKFDRKFWEDVNSSSHPWSLCNTEDNANNLFSSEEKISVDIYLDGLVLENSVADGDNQNGGAICGNNNLQLYYCTISRCFAVNQGGAIFLGNNSNKNIIIKHNYFHDCMAKDGGAFSSLQKCYSNLTIEDNFFDFCSSLSSGGGLNIFCKHEFDNDAGSYKVHIMNNRFWKCQAWKSNKPSVGGGICFNLDNGTNKLDGSVLIQNNKFAYCSVSTVKSNRCVNNGGGLYAQGGLYSNCPIIVKDNVFEGCSAYGYNSQGGGVWSGNSVILDHNFFNLCFAKDINENNQAYGGSVYLCGEMKNSYILSSHADQGGGVYIQNGKIVGSKIVNCYSRSNGAGVNMSANSTLHDCIVANCTSAISGGGVFINSAKDVKISNLTCVNNFADHKAGGVFCDGKMKISNSILLGNRITQKPFPVIARQLSKEAGQEIDYGLNNHYVKVENCAIPGIFSDGGNIAISQKNKPYENSKELHANFKKLHEYCGFIDVFGGDKNQKEQNQSILNRITDMDVSLSSESSIYNFKCSKEVIAMNQNEWATK